VQESDFHDIVDDIYFQLEEIIDESGADIDFETNGGVMTLTCENNGTKVILSRQAATSEIWVAARSGGFHFQFKKSPSEDVEENNDGDWVCATGEHLAELLTRVIHEQAQETLDISF